MILIVIFFHLRICTPWELELGKSNCTIPTPDESGAALNKLYLH